MASSQMENVLDQALATFTDSSGNFRDNMEKLMQTASELDIRTLGLDLRLLRWDSLELATAQLKLPRLLRRGSAGGTSQRPPQAPLTFIRVYQDQNVSIGIFVLRNGGRVPIHDHPGMHSVLKVVYGKVRIQGYTPKQMDYDRLDVGDHIDAVKLPSAVFGADDGPSVLYPEEGNIHEVSANDGPAVFVDILSPPYTMADGPRKGKYFKEVKKSGKVQLTIIPQPKDYFCDQVPYHGPRFVKYA